MGEQAPKLIALQYTEKTALFIARPTAWMATIFNPLVILLNDFCNLLLKMLHIENPKTTFAHSTEELDMLVDASYKEGVLNETEKEMLHNAFKFSDLTAKEVMIPRTDMICIQNDIGLSELNAFACENQYTRYPVFEEDLDHIKGFLHVKDLYTSSMKEENFDINKLIRPILFVPETITLDNIVREFKKCQGQIAIVIDEYGGTAGLITMEDIIEELVGEIYDEHDAAALQDIVQQQDGSYRVLCGTNIDKMFDYFDVEEEIDATTVNGWVVLQIDKLPSVGDHFVYEADCKRFDVTVTKADQRKALEINMIVTELEEEE